MLRIPMQKYGGTFMSVKNDTLLKVLAPSAPSGFEGAAADAIEALLKGHVDELKRDVMGNLFAIHHGKGKKIMFAAHMDQIGFMVTNIDEKGFLRVTALGGINVQISMARHVVMASGKPGVLFGEMERDGKDLTMQHLFIDVGASCREEAESIARIGDWAVYAPQVSIMGERVSSPYMDNRSGCALLIDALLEAKKSDNEICAVFTVQEEVGLRGATTAAWQAEPDLAIAVDVTLVDCPPKAVRQSVQLGKGPAVKVMDRSVICHPEVRAMMEKVAQEKGIEYQLEVLAYGGTDSGAIHVSRGGVPSGVLSIPCRYVHTPAETIDMNDYWGGVRLLAAIMERAN